MPTFFPRRSSRAARNKEAARLWISGLEVVKKKLGVHTVYDLSATPFFLRGSGYVEGTLIPWVVSHSSLMDAIECGIVELPRVPIAHASILPKRAPAFGAIAGRQCTRAILDSEVASVDGLTRSDHLFRLRRGDASSTAPTIAEEDGEQVLTILQPHEASQGAIIAGSVQAKPGG